MRLTRPMLARQANARYEIEAIERACQPRKHWLARLFRWRR